MQSSVRDLPVGVPPAPEERVRLDAEGRPRRVRPVPAPAVFTFAAEAFRSYFQELRHRFLERDTLLAQCELALLAREHVLITGAPGTAKSHLAAAVLRRIVDEGTGQPSVFSRQLTESTVQTDLVGAVDFKVLTETGRTEYLTDDGMLGAVHAFLDEVFDGRDMLLRSILNVLHERELKHGKQLTRGRLECSIMTTNRYLSEVLARSRDLLLAFADRIAFVSFVPKGFVRPESKAAMLALAAGGERAELNRSLTLQQVDSLQAAVDAVEVPGDVLEALARLTENLERILVERGVQRPEYVPTKYFSNRTLVKAVGVLRAAVIRHKIFHAPDRATVATLDDLGLLRTYLTLGGPSSSDAALLLDTAADPRERAQLETVELESGAFDEALAAARTEGDRGAAKEAEDLELEGRLAAARRVAQAFEPTAAKKALEALAAPLARGLRWSRNRRMLEEAAQLVAVAYAQHLRSHGGAAAIGSGGSAEERAKAVSAHRSLAELLERYGGAEDVVPLFRRRAVGYLEASLRAILDRLAAEEVAQDTPALAQVAERAQEATRDLRLLAAEVDRVLALPGAEAADRERDEALRALVAQVRQGGAEILRRRSATAFFRAPRPAEPELAPAERLHQDAELLGAVDAAIAELSPGATRVRDEILGYRAAQLLGRELDEVAGDPGAVFELLRSLGAVFASEGIQPGPVYRAGRDEIEARLLGWLRRLPYVPVAQGPGTPRVRLDPPAVITNRARLGENARVYRAWVREHEIASHRQSLAELDAYLAASVVAPGTPERTFLDAAVGRALAAAERAIVEARIAFLRGFVSAVRSALADPATLADVEAAQGAIQELRGSGLVALLRQELELRTLEERLAALAIDGVDVRELSAAVGHLDRDLEALGKGLLSRRAELEWAAGQV